MPQVELPRLLEPRDFAAQLAAQRDPRIIIVDLSRADAYREGHIPGALHVDPVELIAGTRPAVGKLPPSERLQALCDRLRLTDTSWVVACDDEGGGWAGRLIWTLDVVGHPRWSYLDGGMVAWRAAQLPLVAEQVPLTEQLPLTDAPPADHASGSFRIRLQPGPRIELQELLRRHRLPEVVVWDARSPEEHRGERSGSRRAGRIPGAVNLDWLELMDPDRALRLRRDLGTLLARRGINPDREVITHCQTHHRSGLTYLVGRLLAYPNIRAYDGSWSEWGNQDGTPVEAGPPAGAPVGPP